MAVLLLALASIPAMPEAAAPSPRHAPSAMRLQPPAPGRLDADRPAQTETGRGQQIAGADQSRTAQPMAAVELAPAAQAEAKPGGERQQGQQQAAADWWLDVLTGALAAIAFLQLIAFSLQARRLRQTIGETKLATEATRNIAEAGRLQVEATQGLAEMMRQSVDAQRHAVGAMERTAERQLRAYVSVSAATIKFDDPMAPEAQLIVKNSGQTPAYDVRQWIHIWIERYPFDDLPVPPEAFQPAISVLGPGATQGIEIRKDPPVPRAAAALLGTRRGTVYVYGEIRYRDAFDAERFTRYRLIYGGAEGGRGNRLTPDKHGNEAS